MGLNRPEKFLLILIALALGIGSGWRLWRILSPAGLQLMNEVVAAGVGVNDVRTFPDPALTEVSESFESANSENLVIVEKGVSAASHTATAPSAAAASSSTESASPPLINLNSAPPEELISLPGIGPALADRIVAYRIANGPFQSIDELMAVSGIGPKKLAAIINSVCVR